MMAETREPVRIAVNVMRARLTILGFNLAIITFQIKELPALGGGVKLPGIEQELYVSAAAALFLGMALSFIAMVSLIASCSIDRDGVCDHWSLLAGDLLMYLALAQTVVGFFGAFHSEFERVALPDPEQAQLFALTSSAMDVFGGIAWALAIYLGPLVSLLRSPFGWRITVALALAYLGLLLLVARVWTMALQLEAQRSDPESPLASWLYGLVAPLVW
jgi:hypothetical protein